MSDIDPLISGQNVITMTQLTRPGFNPGSHNSGYYRSINTIMAGKKIIIKLAILMLLPPVVNAL